MSSSPENIVPATSNIAFFDFDGTITQKDTLLEFIKFSKGTPAFYFGFLLNSPWLIAYKLKVISNQRAKEAVLRYFFGKMPLTAFEETCTRFAQECLPGLIRKKAAEEITLLKEKDFHIVIVSASPHHWISPWADSISATLIATRLATTSRNGQARLTGKIEGKNCHGEEKVTRIREKFDLPAYRSIYTYGDTPGDKPMLRLGHHSFMKPFR